MTGRYLGQSQGRDALAKVEAIYLSRDKRGPSLEELAPEAYADLLRHGAVCRVKLREEMQIEFTIDHGRLAVLDAVKVARTARAGLKIAVALAEDGVIGRDEAVLRVEPRSLSELLHPQVDPRGQRDVVAKGIAASPGGAVGRIVFSSDAAQASAARGEPCILVRRETEPEDIRGMHSAAGVLTERGGVTSHAAVIARGSGGALCGGGQRVAAGAEGQAVAGAGWPDFPRGRSDHAGWHHGRGVGRLCRHAGTGAGRRRFRPCWAGPTAVRDIGIRANADTPADAATARQFAAEGIGLCRTEHMFFDEDRLIVMREMIFRRHLERPAGGADPAVADAARRFHSTVRDHGRDAGLHPPV